MSSENLSRSWTLAAKVIYAAFQILKEKGNEAPGRDVVAEVEKGHIQKLVEIYF